MPDQFADYVQQYKDSVKQFEDKVQELGLMRHFKEDIDKLNNIDWDSARPVDVSFPLGEVYNIINPILIESKLHHFRPEVEKQLRDCLTNIQDRADKIMAKFMHAKVGYGPPKP